MITWSSVILQIVDGTRNALADARSDWGFSIPRRHALKNYATSARNYKSPLCTFVFFFFREGTLSKTVQLPLYTIVDHIGCRWNKKYHPDRSLELLKQTISVSERLENGMRV